MRRLTAVAVFAAVVAWALPAQAADTTLTWTTDARRGDVRISCYLYDSTTPTWRVTNLPLSGSVVYAGAPGDVQCTGSVYAPKSNRLIGYTTPTHWRVGA